MVEQYICSKMFTDLNIKFTKDCIKNCCKSIDTSLSQQELEKDNPFIENKEYLSRKAEMLFNNRIPKDGCKTCYDTEPNSLFRLWNEWHETFTDEQKNDLYATDNFTTYEIVLSSACDLKCVYCFPKDSSSWAKELGVPVQKGTDEFKALILKKLIDNLRKKTFTAPYYWFFFSGGEPTYSIETIELIQEIISIVPSDKLMLMITTNANTKASMMEKYLKLIRENRNIKWTFDCSLDGIGEVCEAIRYGCKWETVLANIKALLKEPNVTVRISPTVNLYSVPTLTDFLDYFIKLFRANGKDEVIFNPNMVQEDGLSPMNLPVSYKADIDRAIELCRLNHNHFYEKHLQNVRELIGTRTDRYAIGMIDQKFKYFKTRRPDKKWDLLFPHVSHVVQELKQQI